jgi:hypothetical protein
MREGTSTVGADKPSEEFFANTVKLFLRCGKFFAPFSAQSDKFKPLKFGQPHSISPYFGCHNQLRRN